MSKTDNNIRKIRKSIEEEYSIGDTIPNKNLQQAIQDHAGYDRRTIKKYKRILKQKDVIEEPERNVYTLKRLLAEDEEKEQVDYTADRKNVTVTLNEDAVDKADSLNINKSDFFNRKLLERVSTIKKDVDRVAKKEADEQEDVPFIKDLVMQRAFRSTKNEEKRKKLYRKHYGNYNDFACEELRKTAFTVAKEIGIVEKPEGV